jgi:hypothetical protein
MTDEERHFYGLDQVAAAYAQRGWHSSKSIHEFLTGGEASSHACERILLAGIYRQLVEANRAIETIVAAIAPDKTRENRFLYDIRGIPNVARRGDPIADAPRDLGKAGPRGMDLFTSRPDGLGQRVWDAIRTSGCVTPVELAEFGAARLRKIRLVGPTTVDEIRTFLRDRYGLELAP